MLFTCHCYFLMLITAMDQIPLCVVNAAACRLQFPSALRNFYSFFLTHCIFFFPPSNNFTVSIHSHCGVFGHSRFQFMFFRQKALKNNPTMLPAQHKMATTSTCSDYSSFCQADNIPIPMKKRGKLLCSLSFSFIQQGSWKDQGCNICAHPKTCCYPSLL